MPSSKPDLSIIIVSYNTKDYTIACLKSIVEQTRIQRYEIIVLDNASTDDSPTAIAQLFPQVRLISSKDNFGFARGNNEAAKYAFGRRLLLLNPDTEIIDGGIDKLLSFADSEPQAGIWTGRATFQDGSHNVTCWNDMTIWSLFCRAAGLTWLFPKSRTFNPESIQLQAELMSVRVVDIVVGCYLLIDKVLWERLGGFNPIFFMYGDEVDLCIRARENGARPIYTPTSIIIHHGGRSEPSSEGKLVKVLKGRVTVMKCHWSKSACLVGRWILASSVLVRAWASRIIRPPRRQGSGRDSSSTAWIGAWRRRGEWMSGWSSESFEGKS